MAGASGGDGGTSFDIYHGRDTPSLILYADGQLLVAGGNDQYDQKYFERMLSATETCAFLDRIRMTGFLGVRGSGKNYPFDRIYAIAKSDTPMGGGNYVIQVNGYPSKTVSIYGDAIEIVVPEVRRTYEIVSHYPLAGMRTFVSDRVIVHLERHSDIEYPPDLPVLPWPVGAPSAGSLLAKANARGDLEFDGAIGAQMKRLLKLPGIARYVDQGIEYVLAGRQLLPHESLDYVSLLSLRISSIDELPRCAYRPDLVVATPTPGPEDDDWLWRRKVMYYGPQVVLDAPSPTGVVLANWHCWPMLKGRLGKDYEQAYRFTTNASGPDLVDFYKDLGKPSNLRFRGMITDTYIYVPSQNESIQTLGSGRQLFSRTENGVEKGWIVIHVKSSSPNNEVAILEYDKMPFTAREMAELSR